MSEIDFYIKKLQDLEPRGEWKDVFSNSFEKAYQLIYQTMYLRRNFYIEDLKKNAEILLDLPFSLDDDERLTFRRTQKHIIDLLYQIKSENKKIFIIHGKNTANADKISATLGRLKLDYLSLDFDSKEEKNIPKFLEIAKSGDYAIVTLMADDASRSLTGEGEVSNRVSENVWFQFGYFLSHIGKKNIIIAKQSSVDIDVPIDLQTFKSFVIDKAGDWKKILIEFMASDGIFIEEELKNKVIN